MKNQEITLERQKQIDLANQLLDVKCRNTYEAKLGERTHSETIYEGRTNFKYEVLFCDDNNKISKRIVTISTQGY